MYQPARAHRVNFLYSSGTIKVATADGRFTFLESVFDSRKDLRKLLFLYKDSGAVITVLFDDPHDD